MELRQLAYFVAIAQSGTITAAAQKLHMSQPPLSLQLQKLIDSSGVFVLLDPMRRVVLELSPLEHGYF